MQHGRHGEADSDAGAALVVECGQHFLQASADRAVRVAMAFLAHFGLVDRTGAGAAAKAERVALEARIRAEQSKYPRLGGGATPGGADAESLAEQARVAEREANLLRTDQRGVSRSAG